MNGIVDIARTAGHFTWLEDRIADITGAWVASVEESDARLVLGARSHTHAWHADLWRDRLPELRDIDTESFVVPAHTKVADFMDQLAATTTTVERFTGLYRVLLPRLVTAYAVLLRDTNELVDAPTVRTLRLVLEDTREEAREGEIVLRSLDAEQDASAAEDRFTALINAAGSLAG